MCDYYRDLLHQEYTMESWHREQLEDFYHDRAKKKGTGIVISELLNINGDDSKRFKQQLAEKNAEIVKLRKALTTIQVNYTKRGLIKRICTQVLNVTDHVADGSKKVGGDE